MKKTLCPSEVSGGTPNSCYAINLREVVGYWEDAFILEMQIFDRVKASPMTIQQCPGSKRRITEKAKNKQNQKAGSTVGSTSP
jgi:hypothetical protein